jgi:RNA polymerase sigma factor (TIGR02999 family)
MSEQNGGEITRLLRRANQSEAGALDDLMRAVNDELRAVAGRHMRRVFGPGLPGVTLQPTVLVNEAFLKLIKQRQKYDNRGHFFAIATKVLLRVLMDYNRQRAAEKRGGGWVRVPLDPDAHAIKAGRIEESDSAVVPRLLEVLERLEKLDARKADVVKYRVLFGLTIDETAEALEVAHATVERDWEFARAWLGKELADA